METKVSNRISRLMKEKGYTQRDLAKRANVNESAISRYVNGTRTPTSNILANIATVLGTTSNYLLGQDDNYSFADIEAIISKNANTMTEDEKKELIRIITKEG